MIENGNVIIYDKIFVGHGWTHLGNFAHVPSRKFIIMFSRQATYPLTCIQHHMLLNLVSAECDQQYIIHIQCSILPDIHWVLYIYYLHRFAKVFIPARYLSVCFFFCLFVCLFVSLSVCLNDCAYVFLSVCLSVCLSVSNITENVWTDFHEIFNLEHIRDITINHMDTGFFSIFRGNSYLIASLR